MHCCHEVGRRAALALPPAGKTRTRTCPAAGRRAPHPLAAGTARMPCPWSAWSACGAKGGGHSGFQPSVQQRQVLRWLLVVWSRARGHACGTQWAERKGRGGFAGGHGRRASPLPPCARPPPSPLRTCRTPGALPPAPPGRQTAVPGQPRWRLQTQERGKEAAATQVRAPWLEGGPRPASKASPHAGGGQLGAHSSHRVAHRNMRPQSRCQRGGGGLGLRGGGGQKGGEGAGEWSSRRRAPYDKLRRKRRPDSRMAACAAAPSPSRPWLRSGPTPVWSPRCAASS